MSQLRRLDASERPRERLLRLGGRALTTRELLAILVGSGSPGSSALEVAEAVLERAGGSPRGLGGLSAGSLEAVPGVGRATSLRLLAALELGARAAAEDREPAQRVRGPRDVVGRMGPRLRDLLHEEFHVLLLNSRHRLLGEVMVTRGILDASVVHPREVFRPAIVEGAAGIILVHNHPSGDPRPSPEDRAITRQLVAAGRAIGIPVLDHIVLGEGRHHSFAEAGGIE